MKKFIGIFLTLSACLVAQPISAPDNGPYTGKLDSSNTDVVFRIDNAGYINLIIVDSATVDDTVIVQMLNPLNNSWIDVAVKDQTADEVITDIAPGVNAKGKLYVIWLTYPLSGRLHFKYGNGIYYTIYGRKTL